jgi:parallel beta-helix repeat protein
MFPRSLGGEKYMRKVPIALGAAASVLVLGLSAGAAAASTDGSAHVSHLVYVSHSAKNGVDTSCKTAKYRNINTAIAAVSAGGTVIVCAGTYDEQVVVAKPLTLIGRGATINAKGQKPLKIGPETLPGSVGIGVLGTRYVQVRGFRVTGAGFDAILVGASSDVLVARNYLWGNGDVGVDVNGSSYTQVTNNYATRNQGGGFLVADDIGPNSHNTVGWNTATRNPGGCGVIIAGHSTAGVRDNLVIDNALSYNGTLKSSGGGAGVVIASEVPGETVANTVVEGNHIWGNGLAGVTIHAHEPNQDFNGTQIKGNWIGQNNTLGDPIGLFASTAKNAKNYAVPDTRTTGILAATASSVTGTLIANNHISNNHFGIFLEALSTVKTAHVSGLASNRFTHVVQAIKFVIAHV